MRKWFLIYMACCAAVWLGIVVFGGLDFVSAAGWSIGGWLAGDCVSRWVTERLGLEETGKPRKKLHVRLGNLKKGQTARAYVFRVNENGEHVPAYWTEAVKPELDGVKFADGVYVVHSFPVEAGRPDDWLHPLGSPSTMTFAARDGKLEPMPEIEELLKTARSA